MYTPTVVIDIRFLVAALFVRPITITTTSATITTPTYSRAGVYPWYAFHMSRYGYDPLYCTLAVTCIRGGTRGGKPSCRKLCRSVGRTRLPARPGRSEHSTSGIASNPDNGLVLARPLRDVGRARDFPVRVERLDERRLEVVKNQAKQVREFREARVKSEQEVAREGGRGRARPRTARPHRSR